MQWCVKDVGMKEVSSETCISAGLLNYISSAESCMFTHGLCNQEVHEWGVFYLPYSAHIYIVIVSTLNVHV